VPHSRDFVSGVTLTIMFVYLLLAWPALGDRLTALANTVFQSADRPFAEAAGAAIQLSLQALILITLPPVAIVVAGVFVAGVAATLGPVFSFETVKPKFEHINPVEGLKRIFKTANVVELAKSAIKVAILGSAFFLIMRRAIGPLFEIPVCGAPCLATATVETVKPLAAIAAAAFLVIGLFDLLVQRRLFLREMRMTRTEVKREIKDLEGDPLIRSERRRLRQQAGARNVRAGMRHAVVAIVHGDLIVGLRFKAGETPVPAVVCKGAGEAGAAMLAEARQLGVPVVEDAKFATALAARHKVGDFIATDLFEMAARALFVAGRA
jgi:type III secretion protein U